jgi:hydroxyacylglutathione hydrolase
MIFQQFYLEGLGHASYLLGSEQTGEAFTLDVRRDVDLYYDFARAKGLRIQYAADTHQHNDYLSGVTELRRRSPLELLSGARAELGYEARPLADGDRFRFGEVELEALHTPGHTPEHTSFLVRDLDRGNEPLLLLSGGALLVDDVARPDLLGDAQDTREAARALAGTLRDKILTLPDHVLVYPTHVAGSLCGGNIGAMLVTTVGYEKRLNQLLRCAGDEDDFVSACLDPDRLPTVPPYWARMRGQNQAGPEPLGVLEEPPPLQVDAFDDARREGAIVLDCRQPEAFGGGHVPGALNVGYGSSFATWAGSVLTPDRPVLLLLERERDLWDVAWDLLRIGYAPPAGWLVGGMMSWRVSGRPIARIPQWTVDELHEHITTGDRLHVIDVRQPAEWLDGHVPGARHIPGGDLRQRLDEVPRDRPVAVYCGSGYRSSVAVSLLAAAGLDPVINVLGGFAAWRRRELPISDA